MLCFDPSLELTGNQEGDGANRLEDRTKRYHAVDPRRDKEKSEKEKRQGAEDESYIYIQREGERIQIAEESSPSGWSWTIANDLSECTERSAEVGPPVLRVSFKSCTSGAATSLEMRSLILVVVYAHLALAMVARHHRDSGFLNHVQLVHEFRCSMPQPRAVPVEELLTVGPSPDEVFYPASTVLTRCDGAGCCPDPKQICAPIETRNVSLVFTVKHTIDRQRDRHHEVIHALEHTKCGCVDKKLIKFD